MRLAVCLVVAAALAAPPAAFAHAIAIRTTPANGAVLASPPDRVIVELDDAVRVAPGNAAIRNGDSSVLSGSPTVHGTKLVLPLLNLPHGDYSVRWSVVSQDGHVVQGVLAFAVGTGRAPPVPELRPTVEVGVGNVLLRWLFFAGLLVAAGVALFDVVVWRPLGRGGLPTGWIALGLALTFVAAHGLVHATHAGSATRFGLVVDVSEVLAASGAAAAAIGIADRTAAPFALVLALGLLPVPTLAGHSLDPGRAWVQAPLDFLHVVGAAVWIGGVFALTVIVPREEVAVAARRFSRVALAALGVLVATGVGRALAELAAVSQLWTTGYGRAIVAKSALVVVLLGAAWFSRGGRRAAIVVELALLLGVIVAVAILTATAPGVSR